MYLCCLVVVMVFLTSNGRYECGDSNPLWYDHVVYLQLLLHLVEIFFRYALFFAVVRTTEASPQYCRLAKLGTKIYCVLKSR